MKRFLSFAIVPAVVLGLVTVAGCSLENQAVTIAPTLTYKPQPVGQNQPVYLTVLDKRTSRLIGYRKDETKDRATIVAANDLRAAVLSSVRQILTDNGFVIADSAESSVAQFTVEIDQLSYKAGGVYIAPSVDTEVLLKGTAKRGAVTRSNNYEIKTAGREAKPLTQAHNAELINDIVSKALTMIAEDRQMLNFLAASGSGYE